MKPVLKSKTLWLNFIVAAASIFVPSVADYISKNPMMVTTGFAVLNAILRFISKDKIVLA